MSGKAYSDCCQLFHQGKLPSTALELMRSRYAAYAFCLPEYIIHTTHPKAQNTHQNLEQWTQQIIYFCQHTSFQNLKILDFQESLPLATVTFTAVLVQNGKDASFTEKSTFENLEGKWLYLKGDIQCPPHR